jgi:hypothetical protein
VETETGADESPGVDGPLGKYDVGLPVAVIGVCSFGDMGDVAPDTLMRRF